MITSLSRAWQSVAGHAVRHRRMLGVTSAAVLLFCCAVPRRTESYYRTDLPPVGARPANRTPTDLPVPDGVASFVNSIGIRMIRIPDGDFVMGSPVNEPGRHGRHGDETQRLVRVPKPLYISQTEVTQAEWCAIMEYNPSQFVGDRLPVHNVGVTEVWAFCNRLSLLEGRQYRLPSEVEWEYACRAGTTTPYHTGESLTDAQARVAATETTVSSADFGPKPVGSYRPNAWGLYDMHGNVAELMGHPYNPRDPLASIAGKPDRYYLWKEDAVCRGGAWSSRPEECRSATRDHCSRWAVDDAIGFRIVVLEK